MVSTQNKRIAKNTLFLYFRMLITMTVSLYTVRVVLNTLGIEDFGIHNVVSGVVTMFSFLSSSMASASQRYFAFELGRDNLVQLQRVFSATFIIYVIAAFIIILLAETVGLWFLNHKMVIPEDRIHAAFWVYQFSIFSLIMTILSVPYNALIIAHENMKVFAFTSILEVTLKLLVVYLLVLFSGDRLPFYGALLFLVTCVITFIYRMYCQRKYKESRLILFWDSKMFRELFNYSGWNLFGSLAGVFNNQGINIILNLFFGPIVNAARAIAYQVSAAINQFATNFVTAARPQITKYYAMGDRQQMLNLTYQSSKFSYLMLFFVTAPLIIEADFVLNLWLKNVPANAVLFVRLSLICALIEVYSYPLMVAAQATGRIKRYQVIVGGTMLLNLPVSYLFLEYGFQPEVVFYVAICNAVVCLILRLTLLNRMVRLSEFDFFKKVVLPCVLPTSAAISLLYFITCFLDSTLIRFLLTIGISILVNFCLGYFFALTKDERRIVQKIFFFKKINNVKTDN
ncbi:oligosaccharide flippase family protein [Parapedobacter tibetensis]|uniref:oligosaccharide flippase family protein n=1 Tax=Parapedobacter tibetensis TaxID=2972951 RepID=UPI00214D254C|nr:oligosaccharide flippase family protein [Parapedobacter tibetensis]